MATDSQSPVREAARPPHPNLRPFEREPRDQGVNAGMPDRASPTTARIVGGGTLGNERLTAATGLLLVALLAVIGVTILRLRPLISVHLFVGLVLIPVVCLKLASTGYRFMRYYTSDPAYRKRGAPAILLRASAPILVATSVAVFATGVALLFVGPESSGTLRLLHKASFIVWAAFAALHVLGHLPDLQKTFLTSRGGHVEYNRHAAGAAGRVISIVGALLAGVVLGIVLIPHFGAWTHFEAVRHHH
jgi:hypothetical protein